MEITASSDGAYCFESDTLWIHMLGIPAPADLWKWKSQGMTTQVQNHTTGASGSAPLPCITDLAGPQSHSVGKHSGQWLNIGKMHSLRSCSPVWLAFWRRYLKETHSSLCDSLGELNFLCITWVAIETPRDVLVDHRGHDGGRMKFTTQTVKQNIEKWYCVYIFANRIYGGISAGVTQQMENKLVRQ